MIFYNEFYSEYEVVKNLVIFLSRNMYDTKCNNYRCPKDMQNL